MMGNNFCKLKYSFKPPEERCDPVLIISSKRLGRLKFVIRYMLATKTLVVTANEKTGTILHESTPVLIRDIMRNDPYDIEQVNAMVKNRLAEIHEWIESFVVDVFGCTGSTYRSEFLNSAECQSFIKHTVAFAQ